MFYRKVIAFDRVKQRLEIVSIVLTEEAGGSHTKLRELYDEAVARTKEIEKNDFRRAIASGTGAVRERGSKNFVAVKLVAAGFRRRRASGEGSHSCG